jgi:hemerythrin-like domain-containing protein
MRHFKEEIQKGRQQLSKEVTAKLKQYVNFIRQQIESNFSKFDQLLSFEKEALATLHNKHQSITKDLDSVQVQIKTVMN